MEKISYSAASMGWWMIGAYPYTSKIDGKNSGI